MLESIINKVKNKQIIKRSISFLLSSLIFGSVLANSRTNIHADSGYWVEWKNFAKVSLINIKNYSQPGNLNLYTVRKGSYAEYAYCIEPGVHSLNGSYTAHSGEQYGISVDSRNMYGRINHLAHALSPSGNTAESRAAAQVAIWVLRANADGYSSNHNFPTAIEPMNLLKMANDWKSQPKFKPNSAYDEATNTVKLKKGDTIILEDVNDLPTFFEAKLKKEFPELKVNFEKSEIKITAVQDIKYPLTLRIINHDGNVPEIKVFHHNTSQDVMVVGGIDPADFSLRIAPQTGSLRLIKEDSNNPDKRLGGATFSLYKLNGSERKLIHVKPDGGIWDNNPYWHASKDGGNERFSTSSKNEIGKIWISGLEPGDYILKEIKSPDGYLITNDGETKFTVSSGRQSDVTVKNDKNEGRLRFVKHGVLDNNERVALNGGKFKLYKGEELIKLKKLDGSRYTPSQDNTDDVIIADAINDVYIDNLQPGKYFIKELEAPRGFVISTENSEEVELSAGNLSEIVMTNEQDRSAGIRVYKIDQDTQRIIDDEVIFELRTGVTFAESTPIKVKAVDVANGVYTVSNITAENTLTEQKAPHGILRLESLPVN